MREIITKQCPDCKEDLIKSKSYTSGRTTYFWQKPWATGFFDMKRVLKIYPWACMNCGKVFFYLEDSERENIKREYETEKYKPR